MVGSECGEEREMVVVHVYRRQLCVRKAVAGGRQECGGEHYLEMCSCVITIVSVRISCDSGIAIKIFTHESATTAENLDFILILHIFNVECVHGGVSVRGYSCV